MSVADIRKRTAEAMGDTDAQLPCRWCDEPTPHATLRALGARCQRCFDDYCRAPQSPQKLFVRPEPRDLFRNGDPE